MIIKFLMLLSIAFITCTSNPLWDDPITSELTIFGKISMENKILDTPAIVWLEQSDSFVRTDINDSFIITINNNI